MKTRYKKKKDGIVQIARVDVSQRYGFVKKDTELRLAMTSSPALFVHYDG